MKQAPVPRATAARDTSRPPALSFSQQRMWLLDQLQPESPLYSLAMSIRLQGALDVAALGKSLNAIVARHESLRTTFAEEDGQLVQVVAPALALELPAVDLETLPAAEREAEAERRGQESARRPFDLARGPLLRVELLRLEPREHLLLLTVHHIVFDGWSQGIFVRELLALYRDFSEGRAPSLPPLPMQYADFAHWQRQFLGGDALQRQLSYWKKQLGGTLPVVELPADHARPAVPQHRGARYLSTLPLPLFESLKALGSRESATPFMVLLAAFDLLLWRYTGLTDLPVGTPVAGRSRREAEALIGLFLNTLVLRSDLSGNPTCRELVGRVRQMCLGAYEHQDLPFEYLVDALQPERHLSRTPLFQVLFILQNAAAHPAESSGLTLKTSRIDIGVAEVDLTLIVHAESAQGVRCAWEYSTEVFEEATIARMAEHFQRLLEGIAARPDQRIAGLSLLAEGEGQRLSVEWNATRTADAGEGCLHRVFEEQVARAPEAIALKSGEEQLTYGELNRRANRLAHWLRARGVGPEVPVAICAERSPRLVVGLLGILKAGGHYVPLDPSHPRERLEFILGDSRAPVLLTQERLRAAVPHRGLQVLCLDSEWDQVAGEREDNPDAGTVADNLAYIIYTSGSTGVPKGVLAPHRGALNRFRWMWRAHPFQPGEVACQKTALSFVDAVWEVFGPLLAGVPTVLVPEEVVKDPPRLVDLLEAGSVTRIVLVPSLLQALLSVEGELRSRLAKLSVWVTSGERLPEELVQSFRERLPHATLLNLYGSSEVAADATAGEVDGGRITIGRPISNMRVYVLDPALRPSPVGLRGEIYAGGAGLARGYVHRPDLTAERFVPDPFSAEPGERLYRTGDVGRFLPDGRIEYLGRVDHQVKLRGFRIELGEIEAALRQHPGVQAAVAMVREDVPGNRQLVAYVVAGEPAPGAGPLRAFLQEKLPDYMVPGAFVALKALPLTVSGKVDRQALPAPAAAGGQDFVAPRSALEELIANVWVQVLRRERVGVHDNFFALGGHSLIAAQIASRLRASLQVDVPLRRIFEAPTVAGLAEAVEAARQEEASLTPPPLVPVPRDGALPVSFAQQRLWFLTQFQPGDPSFNVLAPMRLVGPLDAAALERALQGLVRRHEALRTVFVTAGGRPAQVVLPELALELPVVDLSGLPPDEREADVQRRAEEDARRLFDLTKGPLLHAQLLRCAPEEHVLLLVLHHIVSDLWSQQVFFRELAALYDAFHLGRPSPLPALPIQYADFAHWQRQWLSGEVLERQLDYWRQQLSGSPPLLDLPTDRPRPSMRSSRGTISAELKLSPSLSGSLRRLAREEGVTLFMLLEAAFVALLSRYSGEDDVPVGTTIAGRNRTEVEGLIGVFINTLVMRVRLSGDPTFRRLLARTREVALGAYAHQDVPFEKLVDELEPARDLSRTPLFQVAFELRHAAAHGAVVGGLRLSPIRPRLSTAKFDLALLMFEQDEGLSGFFEYSTDLFDGATIERMKGHLVRLLEGVVAQPEARVSELPLLGEEERRRLLVELSTTPGVMREECLHRLFEAQVERTPEALAVCFEGASFTYRELNGWANRLARYLQDRGVGPEVMVGLCLDRGLELVVGVLGILKAGGAYLPMDSSQPVERLSFMMQDAGVPVLVTQERLDYELPSHGEQRVLLDVEWERLAEEEDGPLEVEVGPDNLAYVIYTSGSTGRPKGTLLAHRGASNAVRQAAVEYGMGPGSRVLQFVSIGFDASVQELFATLGAGGTLYLAAKDDLIPGPGLVGLLKAHRISVVTMPPSALAAMPEAELSEVKAVMTGGESCGLEVAKRWGKGRRLVTQYGPTEASCTATSEVWREGEEAPGLGRPFPNVKVYVLDGEMQPVPEGVKGELYVGGVGLARGYLGRPELTAERFVPAPFGEDGGRLYRTGDRARYRAGGRLEFVERVDLQVKVRGHRIELGEVEAVLGKHPGVKAGVVAARDDGPGGRWLVGYVVPREGVALTGGEVREFLGERLPDYMVPGAMVVLEKLPVTGSGKVDRRALPAPGREASARGDEDYVGPRDPLEELLAGIWKEVLGVSRVGVHEDFFALGGHSLIATQVLSRIHAALSVELPLRDFFEAPTVAGMAQKLEGILKGREVSAAPPMEKVPRDGPLPLSFAQQRLWFMSQMEGSGTSFNFPMALKLVGRLDVERLERAFEEVGRRHETLRTTFTTAGGQPVQVIAPELEMKLPVVELQGLAGKAREEEVRRRMEEEVGRPFDLVRGPVLRGRVLRLGPEEHVLVLTMHHIMHDAWSASVLFRELGEVYGAGVEGRQAELPALAVQYADYAQWQRKWLSGAVLERQLSYWRKQLGGGVPTLDLPADRPRPAVQTFRGEHLRVMLAPRSVADGLDAVGRQEGATLFMTLLAAYDVLLYRYTRQQDVVVGSPMAGRTRPELEGLIGFFVNNLAMRVRVKGEESFRELLGQVKEVTLGAYAHQDVPFEQLVDALQPVRDLSRAPLFQVTLSVQNAPPLETTLAGLEVRVLPLDSPTSKWDFSLFISDSAEGLAALVEYSTDLFERETVLRMVGHFRRLLEAVAANPDEAVARLPLVGEEEKKRLLVEWSRTGTAEVEEGCIHRLFEKQVARAPQAVAVSFGKEEVTYGELNRRANQLAHYLRGLYVGPEVKVGLCVERSVEMVVGVLGVLKAGGAYVPLDPSYPEERLTFMLEDSRVPVLLTQQKLAEALPLQGLQAVCLDTEREAIAAEREEDPEPQGGPEDLAYVIYTSGSTGRPKGVLLEHRGLCNTAVAASRAMGLGPGSRALQFASVGFDASVWEMFSALVAGAAVCLAPKEELLPGAPLRKVLEEQRVTAVTLTPSVLGQLEAEGLPALRTVVSAGEACTPEMVARWKAGRRFINAYGPTEVTICATLDAEVEARRPTIGRPLENVEVYVLDERLEGVPVGVPGELCVGGAGLARGYLERPELTAEKFVPHPYGGRPGARLYRTGDLVRYLPDGRLEFVGRIDSQVKVRGHRIELGEVQAVLEQHPGVRRAVVLRQEETPGDVRLVAYLVPKEGPVEEGALRAFLREKLPEYMVPAAFVPLEALPLTAHDKLDVGALPAPGPRKAARGEGRAPPRTPAEELLVEMWSDILGVQELGIHDGFFDLGGHSLLGIRLFTRIQEVFGVELALVELFEHSTVAALAVRISEVQGGGTGPRPPPIAPTPPAELVPLSFAQQFYWLPAQMGAENPFNAIPLAFLIRGRLETESLERSLEELVRRHELLRTTFPTVEGVVMQRIHPPRSVPLPVVDLGHLPEAEARAEAARLASEEMLHPFDMASGPMVRPMLFRVADDVHVLLLGLHHAVADQESIPPLVQELMVLYSAFHEDKPSPLSAPPLQYRDYTLWQRSWLQGSVLESLKVYWRQTLLPLPVLRLPFARPYPENETYRSANHTFSLSPALSASLRQFAVREALTPFMLLLAAFKLLLHRYSGQPAIMVGYPYANRSRVELERLVGMFANIRLLRTEISEDISVRELLGRVRATCLGAVQHEDLPYVELERLLREEGNDTRRPLGQIGFALIHAASMARQDGERSLEVFPLKGPELLHIDLKLTILDGSESFRAEFGYRVELFEDSSIRAMEEYLRVLLECIIAAPEQRIGRLPAPPAVPDEARGARAGS